MGVQIVKNINESSLCFKCCCINNDIEQNKDQIIQSNENINILNDLDVNERIKTDPNNQIIHLNMKNKLKNKIFNKFSQKSNSNSDFNKSTLFDSDNNNNSRFIKIQSCIRGFLFRKKLSIQKIIFKKLNNIEDIISQDKDSLAISLSLSLEGSSISNYKQSLFSGKGNIIKNLPNSNNLCFNLKSKNNMKYKYYGYLKHPTNNNEQTFTYNSGIIKNNNLNNNYSQLKIIKNGYGKLLFSDNTIFISNFINNKTSGISHYIDKNNNEEYIGIYENDIPNGFGIFINNANNHKFLGYFNENGLNGVGVEESQKDQYLYYGEFFRNKKHGYGVLQWKDGTIYEGNFFKNLMNGYSIIKYPENKIYKGQVNKSKLNGFGEFIWPEGKKYIGYYKNDKKDGFGIFLWDIPKNINFCEETKINMNKIKAFIGFWNEGILNGIGLKINDGNIRYGIWKNGTQKGWITNKEIIKKYIQKSQKKYLKIILGKKEDLLNLLKKCYICEKENI